MRQRKVGQERHQRAEGQKGWKGAQRANRKEPRENK